MATINGEPRMKTHVDRMSSHKIITLPGFVDIHCHIREPGHPEKEDYASGTAAALAGGITLIAVMPNTYPPVVNAESFNAAKKVYVPF